MGDKKTLSRLCVAAFLVSLAAGVSWAAEKVQIELKEAAVLQAGEIRLGQIAQVTSRDLAPEGLADIAEKTSLGATPWPGNSRSVTKEQVIMALNRARPAGQARLQIEWRGQNISCTVTIETVKVTGEQIVRAAREYLASLPMLQRDDARIEVEESPRDYVVAAGGKGKEPVLSAFAASADRPWGRIRVFVKISADDKVLATVPLMFLVTVRQKVLVAAKAVNRGELIERSQLESREIVLGPNSIPEVYLENADAAVGKVAVRAIPAGTPLTAASIAEPLAIRRGDDVTLSVKSDHMEVVTKGVAQKDGYLGEMIPVKVFASGKNLNCKVVANGTVELPL